MKSKKLIVGVVLATFLMLMIPNISALNTQLTKNAVIEKIDLKMNLLKNKNELLLHNEEILLFKSKLVNIIVGLGCVLGLLMMLVLCIMIIFVLSISCCIAGFFGGLNCGEPFKRAAMGLAMGVELYYILLLLFAEGANYYLSGKEGDPNPLEKYFDQIFAIMDYLNGSTDELPF